MLLVAVMAFGLASCSEDSSSDNQETASTQPTVNDEDWQTVTPGGGTVGKDDLTVSFPSGTFDADAKVAVTSLAEGEVGGEHEVSAFHEIIMPATIKEPITIKIKSQEQGDDIFFVIRALSFLRSEQVENVDCISYPGTYADGVYTLTLPAVDNGSENIHFAVGLAHTQRWDGESTIAPLATRAGDAGGTIKWHIDLNYGPAVKVLNLPFPDFKNFGLLWLTGEKWQKYVEQREAMRGYITDALKTIQGLGYKIRTDRNIPFIVTTELDEDTFGAFCQSAGNDKNSTININLNKLIAGFDATTLKQTIIHEMMHYFQADYDTRSAYKKAGKCYDQLLMYESGAVWAEKLMDNNNFNISFVLQYLPTFLRGLNNIEDIYKGSSTTDYKMYQDHGYAMSVLLEYMTKKMNLASTVELYEIWHNTNGKTFDNLKAWANNHNFKLFEGENYDDFILSLMKGEVIPLQPRQLWNSKEKVAVSSVGTCNELVESIYPYGAAIHQFTLNMPADSLANKQFSIKQRSDNVKTYVYVLCGNQRKLIETTSTNGEEVVIDGAEMEDMRIKSGKSDRAISFFTITTSKTNSGTYESGVTAELRRAESLVAGVVVSGTLVCTSPTYYDGMEHNINPSAIVLGSVPNAIKTTVSGKKMHVVCHKLHEDEETEQIIVEQGTRISFDIDDIDKIDTDKAKISNLFVDGVFTFKSGDNISFEEYYKLNVGSVLPMIAADNSAANIAQLLGAKYAKVWYISRPNGLSITQYDITRKDWVYKWDSTLRKDVLERIDEHTFTMTNSPSDEIKVTVLFK